MAITLQDGEIYKLTNVTSSTLLDLSDRDNESVVGYPDVGSKSQEWQFEQSGKNWYLKNVARNNYLAPKDRLNPHSATLLIGHKDKFEWSIQVANKDYFSLVVPSQKLAVDLCARGDKTAGADVQLWTQSINLWQSWKIVPAIAEGSTIKLKNMEYEKNIMDLASNEIDVYGLADGGQDRQHWVIGAVGSDGITLKNVKTNTYVACKDATPASGSLIIASATPFIWNPARREHHIHRLFVPQTKLAISLPSATDQAKLRTVEATDKGRDVNWDFQYLSSGVVSTGYYALVNTDTGLTLDTQDGKFAFSTTDSTSLSQRWYARVSDTGVSLQNSGTGTFLAPDDSTEKTMKNGKKLALTAALYEWQLLADGNDNNPAVNIIYVVDETYVIQVGDNTGTSEIWQYMENNNIHWRFEPRTA